VPFAEYLLRNGSAPTVWVIRGATGRDGVVLRVDPIAPRRYRSMPPALDPVSMLALRDDSMRSPIVEKLEGRADHQSVMTRSRRGWTAGIVSQDYLFD